MRIVFTFLAAATLFSGLALAETWTGRLLDASCMDQQKNVKACEATTATTAYAIEVDGKTYKLDETGNTKAADAIKNHAERAANPNAPATPVTAKVTGTKEGDTIKVENLEVQ